MKLLLAFKSFLPRRLIIEIGSKSWFAAGCPIRQRELVRRRCQFGSENWFAAGCQFGSKDCIAVGATVSLHNAQLGSEYHFAAGGSAAAAKQNFTTQHTIDSEYHFDAGGSVAAAKQNFAAQHTNR